MSRKFYANPSIWHWDILLEKWKIEPAVGNNKSADHQGHTKVIKTHPQGTMNVCTIFHGDLSNNWISLDQSDQQNEASQSYAPAVISWHPAEYHSFWSVTHQSQPTVTTRRAI